MYCPLDTHPHPWRVGCVSSGRGLPDVLGRDELSVLLVLRRGGGGGELLVRPAQAAASDVLSELDGALAVAVLVGQRRQRLPDGQRGATDRLVLGRGDRHEGVEDRGSEDPGQAAGRELRELLVRGGPVGLVATEGFLHGLGGRDRLATLLCGVTSVLANPLEEGFAASQPETASLAVVDPPTSPGRVLPLLVLLGGQHDRSAAAVTALLLAHDWDLFL